MLYVVKATNEPPYIVFGSPSIGPDEIAAVTRTLESAWIGTGPRVHEFESAFAKFIGVGHALATSSCTAALHLAMVACGVGAGDEVITTAMTFCATANAIVHTGATPVLVDCQRDTMNIDPLAVEAAVTPRTRAIVPVHFGGRPADMDALRAVAAKHDLLIIEDAAHAIEAMYRGKRAGNLGDVGCFSFYVTKNMTTGEGAWLPPTTPAERKRSASMACMACRRMPGAASPTRATRTTTSSTLGSNTTSPTWRPVWGSFSSPN